MMMARQAFGAAAISNYRAPIAPEDVGTIVVYLTTLKGTK
jgi:hypothetical protein